MVARTQPVAAVALLAWVALVAGCAGGGVGTRRISGVEADRRLAGNVLATGTPSAWSLQTLHRNALLDLYRSDPREALARLADLARRVPAIARVRRI